MVNDRIDNGEPRPKFTPNHIDSLKEDEVFVFGSNLAGIKNVCLPESFVKLLK